VQLALRIRSCLAPEPKGGRRACTVCHKQATPWTGVLADGSSVLDPNRKSGQSLSTPPVTMPATASATVQNLLAFIGGDGTVAASALNPLLGASVRVEALQVRVPVCVCVSVCVGFVRLEAHLRLRCAVLAGPPCECACGCTRVDGCVCACACTGAWCVELSARPVQHPPRHRDVPPGFPGPDAPDCPAVRHPVRVYEPPVLPVSVHRDVGDGGAGATVFRLHV
jgi:hypothetical protein